MDVIKGETSWASGLIQSPGGINCVGTVEDGKDAPAAPRVWQYISLPRGAERPAARTLRTGYCEARGRAERMVDRRETELKNHFDGEQ